MTDTGTVNGRWVLRAHAGGSDWTTDSYKELAAVSGPREFWGALNATLEHVGAVHLFLSRDSVFPDWSSGAFAGLVSVMVPAPHRARFWADMAAVAVVQGPPVAAVSMGPLKRDFCVAKVWLTSRPAGAAGDALRELGFPQYFMDEARFEVRAPGPSGQ